VVPGTHSLAASTILLRWNNWATQKTMHFRHRHLAGGAQSHPAIYQRVSKVCPSKAKEIDRQPKVTYRCVVLCIELGSKTLLRLLPPLPAPLLTRPAATK